MSEAEQQVTETQVTDAPAVAETSAETPSTAATETTEVDSGASDDPEQAEADKALKRGKNWYGRKIDALTREREQERREKLELMEILKRSAPTPQVTQPQDQAPQRSQYGDIEEFFRAQAQYEARRAAADEFGRLSRADKERQQQEANLRQAQDIVQSFSKRLDAGKKDYADFDEVVSDAADIEVGNAAPAIAEADNPAGVMYFLAKNRATAERIASLPAIRAAIEIGRIDANLKAKPQVSNAPPPGKPVGSKPGSSGEPPDNPEAYMAWAKKNLR